MGAFLRPGQLWRCDRMAGLMIICILHQIIKQLFIHFHYYKIEQQQIPSSGRAHFECRHGDWPAGAAGEWEQFQNVTVIAIAHRLQTVRDYDRVIVMEVRVAETGTIGELLRRRSGLFRKMIECTVTKMGLLDIDNLTIFFISKLFLDLIWSIIP